MSALLPWCPFKVSTPHSALHWDCLVNDHRGQWEAGLLALRGGGGVGGGGCQMKGCKLGSGNETATGKVSDVHFHNHLSSAVC